MKPIPLAFVGLTLLVPVLGALLCSPCFAGPRLRRRRSSHRCPAKRRAQFTPVTDSFDYARREVMIPMRDGVKLHTVILVPKGAKERANSFTRTPYDADESHHPRAQLRISDPAPWL